MSLSIFRAFEDLSEQEWRCHEAAGPAISGFGSTVLADIAHAFPAKPRVLQSSATRLAMLQQCGRYLCHRRPLSAPGSWAHPVESIRAIATAQVSTDRRVPERRRSLPRTPQLALPGSCPPHIARRSCSVRDNILNIHVTNLMELSWRCLIANYHYLIASESRLRILVQGRSIK